MPDKLEWRNQKEHDENMKLFERTTLKRTEFEKKYKKLQNGKNNDFEWQKNEKQQKI